MCRASGIHSGTGRDAGGIYRSSQGASPAPRSAFCPGPLVHIPSSPMVELGSPLRELLGASVRHSARGKGHEEGGSTYAKAGSSLRSPPGNPRASTPITRACLPYYFVLSPTPLTLRGAAKEHSEGGHSHPAALSTGAEEEGA